MSTKLALLKDRAAMLAKARSFFSERTILEVDCPAVSASASVDEHIDLISLYPDSTHYLHSSPEYGMKRLLADGIGDIYQLSHVFRDGELSAKHNPEFLLAEWYRVGYAFEEMIHETAQFIQLFLGELPLKVMSYREVFREFAGVDYQNLSAQGLLTALEKHGIHPHTDKRDDLLNLLLGAVIEPQLGKDHLLALTYYPASQCALAQTTVIGGEPVAERFEFYYRGLELANGYHELADPVEQRRRLEEANKKRSSSLPIDENFLAALEKGLPDCCGVAVGFDRLMMLRHKRENIDDVLPFGWRDA